MSLISVTEVNRLRSEAGILSDSVKGRSAF
jgi:hypothetical protein